jgi:ElaB/YqjD/DUF883 family membrane-anchored ribosome-binding protein
MTTTARSNAAEELQSLREDLSDLRKDMTKLLRAIRNDGTDKLSDIGSRVGSTIHDKAAALRQHAEDIGARIGEHGKEAKKRVEEHPFKTAAAALGVGLLIGAILRRHGA